MNIEEIKQIAKEWEAISNAFEIIQSILRNEEDKKVIKIIGDCYGFSAGIIFQCLDMIQQDEKEISKGVQK